MGSFFLTHTSRGDIKTYRIEFLIHHCLPLSKKVACVRGDLGLLDGFEFLLPYFHSFKTISFIIVWYLLRCYNLDC